MTVSRISCSLALLNFLACGKPTANLWQSYAKPTAMQLWVNLFNKKLKAVLSQWEHLLPTPNLLHAYGEPTTRYGFNFWFLVCDRGAQQCGTPLLQMETFDWYSFQDSSSK